jgi:acyl carrier protein
VRRSAQILNEIGHICFGRLPLRHRILEAMATDRMACGDRSSGNWPVGRVDVWGALVDRSEIIEKTRQVMMDVMDLDELHVDEGTTASDVEDWDSLTHIRLVVAIEQAFRVKFTTGEVESFKNVGDMVTVIDAKLAPR